MWTAQGVTRYVHFGRCEGCLAAEGQVIYGAGRRWVSAFKIVNCPAFGPSEQAQYLFRRTTNNSLIPCNDNGAFDKNGVVNHGLYQNPFIKVFG